MKSNLLPISCKAVGFLVWFRNKYRTYSPDSISTMAKKKGDMSYTICRNVMNELLNGGYLTFWSSSHQIRRYYINQDRYNELVNPFILNPLKDK